MKDLFSRDAEAYRRFRPQYPSAFFEAFLPPASERKRALDVATGNGQAAGVLASFFGWVDAIDLSKAQLEQATPYDNVYYRDGVAEELPFPDDCFDLIVVAQAAHWFDLPAFYREVKRVSRPEGSLLLLGYGLIELPETIQPALNRLYLETLGPHWDAERRHIDTAYRSLEFPFEESRPVGPYRLEYVWTKAQVLAYLDTWSAVGHYRKKTGENPLENFSSELEQLTEKDEHFPVNFPLFYRFGKVG